MSVIAIDIGTTNFVVSIFRDGKTTIIPIKGQMITPSVILFKDREILIGCKAKENIYLYPDQIVVSIKNDIGNDIIYNILGEIYTPIDILTYFLLYIKEESGKYLNESVSAAIITIHDSFSTSAIDDTVKAAKTAGINLQRLIPESICAAIGYNIRCNRTILFVDIGGGFSNISVVERLANTYSDKCKVLSTMNIKLGGDDFDYEIVKYLISEGAPNNKQIELKTEAEKIKIQLSVTNNVSVDLSFCNCCCLITIEDYKQLIKKYIDEIVTEIKNTISSSGKNMEDIDRVVLVGGSCKHPIIQEAVKNLVGREPHFASNMHTIVAEGAAMTDISVY